MDLILVDKDGKEKPVSFSGPPDTAPEIKKFIEPIFPGYTLKSIDGVDVNLEEKKG